MRRPAFIRGLLFARPTPLPQGTVGPVDRARLTAEILVAYVELLRLLRRNDLAAMVSGARRTLFKPLPPMTDIEARDTAARLGRMVNRVLRKLPTDHRCLIHALVLTRVLAHRSIHAQIVIGVQSGEQFCAHAWVEHASVPILPSGEFARLVEL